MIILTSKKTDKKEKLLKKGNIIRATSNVRLIIVGNYVGSTTTAEPPSVEMPALASPGIDQNFYHVLTRWPISRCSEAHFVLIKMYAEKFISLMKMYTFSYSENYHFVCSVHTKSITLSVKK